MKDSDYVYYLRDAIHLLYERGKKAKADYLLKRMSQDDAATAFANGIVVGYYECLDALFNQAKAFDLPLQTFCPDVDPDELMRLSS